MRRGWVGAHENDGIEDIAGERMTVARRYSRGILGIGYSNATTQWLEFAGISILVVLRGGLDSERIRRRVMT